MADVRTPLTRSSSEMKKFYFVSKEGDGNSGGSVPINIPLDIEGRSRRPTDVSERDMRERDTSNNSNRSNSISEQPSWFNKIGSTINILFGRRNDHAYQSIVNKPRSVPIKVEPKVFFANERTFLAWMHMSVTLASISVAIVAFAEQNNWSQFYGLLILPVAIAFCCYSLWMYMKRSAMIRRKDPGPYDDKFGPVVLACMLGISILINFFVKLYEMST